MKEALLSASATDTGRVREHNEDSLASAAEIGLYVLADGMGGYSAGEVASGIAVNTTVAMTREAFKFANLEAVDHLTRLSRPAIILRDAVQRANKLIHQTAATQPQCQGMGTTIVAALFYDNTLLTAHVGDSRLYRVRGDQLEQMTADHSLLAELVARGMCTEEEAKSSNNKNYVTRALGIDPSVDVTVGEYAVEVGDFYLLCSDGLTDMLEHDEIYMTINRFQDNPAMIAQQLVARANDYGGKDNVSVIGVLVAAPFPAHKHWITRLRNWLQHITSKG
jgi:protein phosphatase